MILLAIGVFFVITGIVIAAVRTAERGRLSQANTQGTSAQPNTLEPSGKGKRLSLKSDLPGLAMVLAGVLLILLGAFWS